MWWMMAWVWAKPPAWIEAPAFTAKPALLLKEAKAITTDQELVVLLDEERILLDEQGRRTVERRLIWQPRAPEALQSWGTSSATWAPWRSERPTIEARIIQPDGTVVSMDPARIVEGAASQDPKLLDDRRTLTVPLNGLMVGGVVEEVTTTRDRDPFLGGGSNERLLLTSSWTDVGHRYLRVEADPALPFDVEVVQSELEPRIQRSRHTNTVALYVEKPALATFVPLLPDDHTSSPYLRVTTTSSWQAAGRAYAALLGPIEATDALAPWVRRLENLPSDAARIDEAYRIARDEIRYTGMELGVNAIVPHPPEQVLAQGYGDCKDKAAVMIALLEPFGVDARIALLDSGPGLDVTPTHASPASFDHAIVHLPASDRWLDPTDGYRPADEVPWSDQGRHALVIGPDGGELKRIPSTTTATSLLETRVEMAPIGAGRIAQDFSATGWVMDDYRDDFWEAHTPKGIADYGARWADNLAARLVDFSIDPVRDVDTPFRFNITLDRFGSASTGVFDAYYQPELSTIFGDLPKQILGNEPIAERTRPVQISPIQIEERLTVVDPPGFEPDQLPTASSGDFGPVHFEREVERRDNETHVVQRLSTGHGRLTVEQAEALRLFVTQHSEPALHWVDTAHQLVQQGRHAAAFEQLARDKQERPNDPRPWLSESWQLSQLGYRDLALVSVREAVARAEDRPLLHRMHAELNFSDPWGRIGKAPFLRDEALAVYTEHLIGDDATTTTSDLQNTIVLYEKGYTGVHAGPGSDLEAALKHLEQHLRIAEEPLYVNQVQDLLRLGRCDEAAAVVRTRALSGVAKLATDTCQSGPSAALAGFNGQQEQRIQAARSAALMLGVGPLHARAGELLTAIAGSVAQGEMLEKMGKSMQVEKRPTVGTGPEDAYYAAFYAAEAPIETTREVFATAAQDSPRIGEIRGMIRGLGIPAWYTHLKMSQVAQIDVEGSKKLGWHLTMSGSGREDLLLVHEDGRAKIRAWGIEPAEWAEEIRARIAAGDLKGARQWLAWVRQIIQSVPAASQKLWYFQQLYREPEDLDDARALVAALHIEEQDAFRDLPYSKPGPDELSALQAAIERATDTAVKLSWAHVLVVNAAAVEAWEIAERGVTQVAKQEDPQHLQFLIAHRRAGEHLTRYLEAHPDLETTNPSRFLRTHIRLGDLDVVEAVAARHPDQLNLQNTAAWALLADPDRRERAEAVAARISAAQPETYAYLHTAATAHALLGRLDRVVEQRNRALAMFPHRGELPPSWGLVDGLVLHHLGFTDAARAHFDRLPRASGLRGHDEYAALIPEGYR